MVKFQSTNQMLAKLEEIIKHTKNQITLISPYIKPDKKLFEKLDGLVRGGKNIRVVYGKDEMNREVLGKLRELKSCSLYFYEDLHAKCYFNENEMIIGSLNLLLSSEKNREMGVFLDNQLETDKEAFKEAVDEAEEIIKSAESDPKNNIIEKVSQKTIQLETMKKISKEQGFCIRCQSPIGFDPEKPLCPDDFKSWNRYKDITYPENFCHRCGKSNSTSFEKPLCAKCFKELN